MTIVTQPPTLALRRERAPRPGGALFRQRRAALASLLLACVVSCLPRAPAKPPQPQESQRMHLFLLVGQSNMAGRGDLEPEDEAPIEGVFALDASGH